MNEQVNFRQGWAVTAIQDILVGGAWVPKGSTGIIFSKDLVDFTFQVKWSNLTEAPHLTAYRSPGFISKHTLRSLENFELSEMARPADPPYLEALAALEHERWSGWMKYQTSKVVGRSFIPAGSSASITGSAERGLIFKVLDVDRWSRQQDMPYSSLAEDEKESDRKEARKTIALLSSLGALERELPYAQMAEKYADLLLKNEDLTRNLEALRIKSEKSYITERELPLRIKEIRSCFQARLTKIMPMTRIINGAMEAFDGIFGHLYGPQLPDENDVKDSSIPVVIPAIDCVFLSDVPGEPPRVSLRPGKDLEDKPFSEAPEDRRFTRYLASLIKKAIAMAHAPEGTGFPITTLVLDKDKTEVIVRYWPDGRPQS